MKKAIFLPLLLIFTVISAFAIAITIVVLALRPPMEDIRLLFVFMLGTGSTTTAFVYLLYHFKLIQRFRSLRWALLAIILLLVVLIFINVWVTAQLMFI